MIALICSRASTPRMGLVLHRVRPFICIMPRLPTIVANAGWKSFGLGGLFMCPLVPRVEDNHGQDGPSTVGVSL
jgi:hypothetical protein